MANGLPQNSGQRIPTPNQQSRGGTPAPENSGQPSPAGARPVNVPVPPGSPFNFPPGTTRIIRHEAIGPNGERYTTTINNTTITIPAGPHQQPILPRPFPHPPHIPGPIRPPGQVGDNVDQLLGRVRNGLLAARQEMDNVRVLFQGPGGQPMGRSSMASVNPPTWRIEQIRQHVRNLGRNLDQVQQGLASILAEPSLAQNPDVLSLQAAANELRAHAEHLNASLDELQGASSAEPTPPTTNTSSGSVPSTSPQEAQASTTQAPSQQTARIPPATSPGPELFLLSSPQGPVGVLFDQRGTYTTAPLQTAAGAQPQQDQQAPPNQNQNQNQAQNPAAEQDRLAIIAGHMWLFFKLAFFVYIFAGGDGWYRPIMMGIVAAIVYLAQLGIFENQFNRIRQHFEALLPMPERPGQNQAQAQGAGGQAQAQQQRLEPDRNLTPEQAAQRIIQQQQENHPLGWIRQHTRTVERAFALFVASLWPGLGERMVQAQEEREREERRAEEERQRQEEERQQQEAQQAEQKAEASASEESKEQDPSATEGVPRSSKGKEKAEVAPEDGPSSS
ncbi:hypothetical protein BDV96DRAFT_485955 [Lophiotrema nucula]|uniref:Uncharacterized protein n=1 Tax=Lophiotrema nucula TaxID=690887 RepID=A0A6A5ZKW8_9PLEO|nr:hypothetical protein BDV96DRAFT_485955 [Lophiotrema nucula]